MIYKKQAMARCAILWWNEGILYVGVASSHDTVAARCRSHRKMSTPLEAIKLLSEHIS